MNYSEIKNIYIKRELERVKRGEGFTLIEILLVIAIIGLLSSIVFVGASALRPTTRDARRQVETSNIIKALTIYQSEYGKYPEVSEWVSIEEDGDLAQSMAELFPTMPRDPLYGQTNPEGQIYSYQYRSFLSGKEWGIKVLYEKRGIVEIYSSPAIPFAEALDFPGLIDMNFSTGGDAAWVIDSDNYFYGGSSIRSSVISDNQSSYWQVTPKVDGIISLRIKRDSEPGDTVTLTVLRPDGSIASSFGLSGHDWDGIGFNVPANHTVRVTYKKDGSGSAGEDCAWSDYLSWTP